MNYVREEKYVATAFVLVVGADKILDTTPEQITDEIISAFEQGVDKILDTIPEQITGVDKILDTIP